MSSLAAQELKKFSSCKDHCCESHNLEEIKKDKANQGSNNNHIREEKNCCTKDVFDMESGAIPTKDSQVSTFIVAEMDCPTEESLIRKKLATIVEVTEIECNILQRIVKITHQPSALPDISKALESLNLGATLVTSDHNEQKLSQPSIPWRNLLIGGAFALGSEIIEFLSLSEWLSISFAVIAILFSGLTTYKKGWISVKNFDLNINALMSIAVTGAVLIGQYPEGAMVMVLFNVAEAIEAKALNKARTAVQQLLALAPQKATVQQQDNSWIEKNIQDIKIGSTVRVKPGERISLDGTIIEGSSAIDQAPITGESIPVEKTAGDTVFAGTINQGGSFTFSVTKTSDDTTLAKIIYAVENAQGTKAPIQRFIDKFSKVYTPAVLFLALLVALIPPLFMGGLWKEWLYQALVLLVIGCPCALVISTPVSIVSGMAAATRLGILIKGGMFLEVGRKLRCIAFDKTGTITQGKPVQTDFIVIGKKQSQEVLTLAYSIASRSDHPVSKTIAEEAKKNTIASLDVSEFTALLGLGTSGVIDGKKWYLGNQRLVEKLQAGSPELYEQVTFFEKQGKTVVLLIGDDGVAGLFTVADTIKDTSITAISSLRKLGIKTVMLTGDNEYTALAVAKQAGIESVKSGLMPEDKLNEVKKLSEYGTVGMVGDGINDAPALAKADIGFAMASAGTDTAIETADVALMDDDLQKIPRFIELSKATYTILMQNITMALGIKGLFLLLTLSGHATMWMAVFADIGTSLLVVGNGLRATKK